MQHVARLVGVRRSKNDFNTLVADYLKCDVKSIDFIFDERGTYHDRRILYDCKRRDMALVYRITIDGKIAHGLFLTCEVSLSNEPNYYRFYDERYRWNKKTLNTKY